MVGRDSVTMLAAQRSAGVAPKVRAMKHASEEIQNSGTSGPYVPESGIYLAACSQWAQ